MRSATLKNASNSLLHFLFPWSLQLEHLGRPQIHPNYGFIKQLDTFAKCNYEPSPSHPTYRSWKRRHSWKVASQQVSPRFKRRTFWAMRPADMCCFSNPAYVYSHWSRNSVTSQQRLSPSSWIWGLHTSYQSHPPKFPLLSGLSCCIVTSLSTHLQNPSCFICRRCVLTFTTLWRAMGWSSSILLRNLVLVRPFAPTVSYPSIKLPWRPWLEQSWLWNGVHLPMLLM